MNDPTKRIDVEKSSLLSLKAELLRKQEEVLKNKKAVPAFVKHASKKTTSSLKPDSKRVEKARIVEVEDSNLIAKSRKVLEAKAKYYDRMVKNKGSTNGDDNSLVLFNKKTQLDKSDSDDDEMVEYTDCFGRSRRILKTELHKVKEQDEELSNVVESREEQIDPNRDESTSSSSAGEISQGEEEPFIGPDIGLQFLKQREDWQKQEELNKERTSIHYRDILFDEAREHGVGFYEFSTDHDERQKQQEALSKIRDATLDAQQQRADLKKSRDDVIANRVKLAKARVRARLGLPPEEEKPIEDLYDATDKKKEKEEEAARKKLAIEKQKDRERQKHVRPWDKRKISSKYQSDSDSEDSEKEWTPKTEYRPMSQDEWNEKQRLERKQEFGPISNSFVRSEDTYDPNSFLEDEKDEKSLFFTTSKKFKRRNQSPEPKPQKGAAIPPPATFEYFGPSSSKQTKPRLPQANLEDSISAGLKFLREQVDKGNKHKWSSANDYTNS